MSCMISLSEKRTDLLLGLLVTDCGDADLELYNSIDETKVSFSKKHQRKARKIIENGKIEPFSTVFKRAIQRIAVIFLIVVSLSVTTIMSVSAIRESIFGYIAVWYQDHISINPPTTPTIIEEVRKPTKTPTGAQEEVLINSIASYVADYYIGDEHIATFKQYPQSAHVVFDIENATVSKEIYNDTYMTIIEQDSKDVVIYWSDSEYFYILTGYDVNLLKEMAISVK